MKSRSNNIREMYKILVKCDGFEYKEVKKNMKVFKLEKWLCGIVMMFALVFITSQMSFAMDENTTDLSAVAQAGEQNITSSNQGEVGIARYKIPSKVKKELRELDKMAAAAESTDANIQLYTTFSSDIIADEETGDVPVVPTLLKEKVYLYVAFRVTKIMTVDIRWKIDGIEVHTEPAFKDPITGGDLRTNFWYFAWFKPASSDITKGLHILEVSVKKATDGTWDVNKDDSKFLVVF